MSASSPPLGDTMAGITRRLRCLEEETSRLTCVYYTAMTYARRSYHFNEVSETPSRVSLQLTQRLSSPFVLGFRGCKGDVSESLAAVYDLPNRPRHANSRSVSGGHYSHGRTSSSSSPSPPVSYGEQETLGESPKSTPPSIP